MKKLIVAAFILFAALGTQAQDGSAPQQAVKINPLSLFLITGNVAYEHKTADNQSFQIGAFYSGVSLSGLKYSGLGITPEYRFYFAGHKEALNGVYAAPFLRYQSFTLKEKSTLDKANYSSFGGGALIGWEKASPGGFVIDLFVGPAYNAGRFKNDADEDEFDISGGIDGFGVRAGISLGFAF
jgi:hypothetical protein